MLQLRDDGKDPGIDFEFDREFRMTVWVSSKHRLKAKTENKVSPDWKPLDWKQSVPPARKT